MNCGTVLYVEDEENDVIFLRHAWKKAAVLNPIQTVEDGALALEYLSGSGKYGDRLQYPIPCMVLLDLKLPKVSGLEVLRWIRRESAHKTLPVVILSSSNQPMDTHQAQVEGANAYLVKPPTREGLLDMAAQLERFWLDRGETPSECLTFHTAYPTK
jgi:CheY-like chemotaxis protein